MFFLSFNFYVAFGNCISVPFCVAYTLLLTIRDSQVQRPRAQALRSYCLDPNTALHYLGTVCLVSQSCPTLCDPMNSSPPGSSVHGILQATILEWAAISFSKKEKEFFTLWQISLLLHTSIFSVVKRS